MQNKVIEQGVEPFFSGIMTGMFLQLALGPVFFYILGITLDSSYFVSLVGIIAVTLADYIYIVLSLIGVGSFLSQGRLKQRFAVFSALVLIGFGLMTCQGALAAAGQVSQLGASGNWTPLKSFTGCFILTMSSPLTILFWTSVFSARAIEKNYEKKQLVVFGFGTGFATFLFLSLSMLVLSFIKSGIPGSVVQALNGLVGVLLIIYGLIRLIKIFKERS